MNGPEYVIPFQLKTFRLCLFSVAINNEQTTQYRFEFRIGISPVKIAVALGIGGLPWKSASANITNCIIQVISQLKETVSIKKYIDRLVFKNVLQKSCDRS